MDNATGALYTAPGRLHRWWIWFWYNDVTRFLLVLFPGHFLVTLPLLWWLKVDDAAVPNILCATYAAVFVWAMLDNDYSKLRRIGLNEYRQPLRAHE